MVGPSGALRKRSKGRLRRTSALLDERRASPWAGSATVSRGHPEGKEKVTVA